MDKQEEDDLEDEMLAFLRSQDTSSVAAAFMEGKEATNKEALGEETMTIIGVATCKGGLNSVWLGEELQKRADKVEGVKGAIVVEYGEKIYDEERGYARITVPKLLAMNLLSQEPPPQLRFLTAAAAKADKELASSFQGQFVLRLTSVAEGLDYTNEMHCNLFATEVIAALVKSLPARAHQLKQEKYLEHLSAAELEQFTLATKEGEPGLMYEILNAESACNLDGKGKLVRVQKALFIAVKLGYGTSIATMAPVELDFLPQMITIPAKYIRVSREPHPPHHPEIAITCTFPTLPPVLRPGRREWQVDAQGRPDGGRQGHEQADPHVQEGEVLTRLQAVLRRARPRPPRAWVCVPAAGGRHHAPPRSQDADQPGGRRARQAPRGWLRSGKGSCEALSASTAARASPISIQQSGPDQKQLLQQEQNQPASVTAETALPHPETRKRQAQVEAVRCARVVPVLYGQTARTS